MANQIDFTPAQLAQIDSIRANIANGTAKAADAYNYIYGIIQNNPSVDDLTKFWFKGAAQINANLPTQTNVLVRSVTTRGLQWDGKSADIQVTSDSIGTAVLSDISISGGILPLEDMLQKISVGPFSTVSKR